MRGCDRSLSLLEAHHDGELGAWSRWRLERHLRRCARCEGELRRIGQVSRWVRGTSGSEAVPDLWSQIEGGLPALDSEIERSRASAPLRQRIGRPRFLIPLGAGVAVATAAVAALSFLRSAPEAPGGTVRALYSPTQEVMILEDSPDSTIIWVMDPPVEQHSQGAGRAIG